MTIFQLQGNFAHDYEWYLKVGSGTDCKRMTVEDLKLLSESLVIPAMDSSQWSPNPLCPFSYAVNFPLFSSNHASSVILTATDWILNLFSFQVIKTERMSSGKYGQIEITNSVLHEEN